jgi:hypothetical protein
VIYWTGRLRNNQVITIDAQQSTAGTAAGDVLPGLPVDVHIFSPAIELVARPGPQNGWRKVSFRCKRSTDRSVTINIQWSARR